MQKINNIQIIDDNLLIKGQLDSEFKQSHSIPDSKVHGANIGPTWVLSAPDGPHVGPMKLALAMGEELHSAEIYGCNCLAMQ